MDGRYAGTFEDHVFDLRDRTVPAPLVSDDFLSAAFGALHGDWSGTPSLVRDVHQRVSDRFRGKELPVPVSDDEALESLRRSYDELSERVAALERQARGSLADILDRLSGFELQFRTLAAHRRALEAQALSCKTTIAQQVQDLRSLESTARIQQIAAAVNAAQTAAYGTSGSVLSTDNLLLVGNQLFWSFLEPLLRKLGVDLGPSPSALAWLAPVGSLVTGEVLLGERQHVRFLTGIATFDGTSPFVVESLRRRIAPDFRREFERRTDVPVTATAIDPMGNVRIRAQVVHAILLIVAQPADGPPPKGRIAWMVDTGVDAG
jgi:hypothetical protein